jgi:hypothetical protein
MIPLRRFVAVTIVEGGMQAPDYEWHGRESGSCIQIAENDWE